METFFTLLFMVIIGVAIGAGCMYFYFKKCRLNLDLDKELFLEGNVEASKLTLTPSIMAVTLADDTGASAQIIPIEDGDEIVVKPYKGEILVVGLYAGDDNKYDDE